MIQNLVRVYRELKVGGMILFQVIDFNMLFLDNVFLNVKLKTVNHIDAQFDSTHFQKILKYMFCHRR